MTRHRSFDLQIISRGRYLGIVHFGPVTSTVIVDHWTRPQFIGPGAPNEFEDSP